MIHDAHNDLQRTAMCELAREGVRIGWEVGIPGGRIDVVVLEDGQMVRLLEVKVREHAKGIAQLVRYGSAVGGSPRLTLVVQPAAATDSLHDQAAAAGVDVWALEPRVIEPGPEWSATVNRMRYLPYIHPESSRASVERRAAERAARAKAIRATLEQPTQWGAPAPLPPALPVELRRAA